MYRCSDIHVLYTNTSHVDNISNLNIFTRIIGGQAPLEDNN